MNGKLFTLDAHPNLLKVGTTRLIFRDRVATDRRDHAYAQPPSIIQPSRLSWLLSESSAYTIAFEFYVGKNLAMWNVPSSSSQLGGLGRAAVAVHLQPCTAFNKEGFPWNQMSSEFCTESKPGYQHLWKAGNTLLHIQIWPLEYRFKQVLNVNSPDLHLWRNLP